MKKKSLLITFEGGEGAGKSTQIKRTFDYLSNLGYRVLLLREPGGTKVGEAIRNVLLDKEMTQMTQETELLLYLAARAQIVREKILPALKRKEIVICDRFEDSTIAYQSFGRGIDSGIIKKISEMIVRCDLKPNLTFLLDIDPKSGMARGGRSDRMEKQSFSFHQKVRKGFLSLAKREPKRIRVIDAKLSVDHVFSRIKESLDNVL